MTELIKVNYDNDTPTVSARELHEFLEVDTPYHKWFPRMVEYGFTENVDYLVTDIFVPNPNGGKQTQMDHQLTIEMGKEISMLQRNEKGGLVRKYFIGIEKDWNTPELVMARALKIANARMDKLKTSNAVLEQKVSEYEPKIQYLDMILQSQGVVAATQIAADYGLSARKLNEILHEEHIQHNVGGQWILYRKHMNLGYTKSETIAFKHSDGRPDTTIHTKWTQKGRLLIHNLLKNRGIMANMDKGLFA